MRALNDNDHGRDDDDDDVDGDIKRTNLWLLLRQLCPSFRTSVQHKASQCRVVRLMDGFSFTFLGWLLSQPVAKVPSQLKQGQQVSGSKNNASRAA